ncbi:MULTISPECIES: LysR family transcriptional regulator [Actinomadura]|uniref:DNA-binding transcriptional regulator, LysR family n=1 Tax=Actinomadura madurae TaxID=1993 RepID=A0A1I5RHV3_9ACTN|nr:LysR family transcriptional regulator [Actinomadura madurae]SFP57526.1 DNA-binding transcriptional regulator, LysR family [Actinomadura madurae]SPT59289.1 HTH-type transcriptional regulator gltC [Actinomadura madurae]
MELRQLEYFVAVAEERSFTRGAQRAHVVQSAASAAVSRLEQQFQTALFDRSHRRLELTTAGRTLLARARAILAEARRAHEEMSRLSGGVTGAVTLGTILSTGDFDLIDGLSRFQREHPDVVVRLRRSVGSFNDHAAALREGRYDLMLLPMPADGAALLGGEVITDPIAHLRLGLACRGDDPLARARNVAYADLADRRFIDFPVGWGNRSIVDSLFKAAAVERTVALEVVDTTTAMAMVQRRLGLAFVPQEQIAARPGLVQVDLADPPPLIDLALALSRDHPPSEAARALRRTLLAGG